MLIMVVVILLSAVLMVVGVQIFFILREVQKSIQKVNKMLDDAGQVSESIAKPLAAVSESLTNLSGLGGFLGWLVSLKKKKETTDE